MTGGSECSIRLVAIIVSTLPAKLPPTSQQFSLTLGRASVASIYTHIHNIISHSAPLLVPGVNSRPRREVGESDQHGDGLETQSSVGSGKSWVSLNNPAVLKLSGQLTLEAWIHPDATQGPTARILSHGPPTLSSYLTDTTPREGAILLGNEVSLRIDSIATSYAFGTTDGVDVHGVSFPIPEGDLGGAGWIHLVGTYDGSKWTLYRNGTSIATAADPAGPLAVDNGGWGIGSTGNGWADAFTGGIDEVAIYSAALSATQVAAHYNAATRSGDQLSIARVGSTVTLTWSGGTLQESASITGIFSTVAGAVSPLTLISPANTRFYRLIH